MVWCSALTVGPTIEDAVLLFSLHGSQCLPKVRVQGLRRRPAEPLSLLFIPYPVVVGGPLKQAGGSPRLLVVSEHFLQVSVLLRGTLQASSPQTGAFVSKVHTEQSDPKLFQIKEAPLKVKTCVYLPAQHK